MRRLLIIAAAATLLAPPSAMGRDHGDGRGEGRSYERYPAADRGRDDRGQARGAQGLRYQPDPALRRREDPRNAPQAYRAAPAPAQRSWRQGQYLPPNYRGAVVQNPSRYRLRAPPRGYDWVGVGPDIYLMQRGTGMVLDAIPGGY
ncbi:MAG TPA: RcnB family protein [Caulobacteraceae bacterium]|jgi:Ni/Co efflux regulator RcnB|nr:RcnB family protein [Caulobacteraceae bacterium]